MIKGNKYFLGLLSLFLLFTGCNKKQPVVEAVTLEETKEFIQEQKQKYPERIITLSPAATEILFAIGAEKQIAAVSDYSDYPPEAAALPKVGGFDGKTLSIEKVLSFEPDFVYLTSGMHDFLIPSLEQFKIQYYVSAASSINDVTKEIYDIGLLTGHFKEAAEIVLDIKAQLVTAKTSGNSTKVYYEVWNSPYMAAGKKSFINDIIESTGASNCFDLIPEAYPIIAEESLIVSAPEVILIPAENGISVEDVKNRNGWSTIPAVVNNKIFIVDGNLFSRPGPRIGQAVKELSELVK